MKESPSFYAIIPANVRYSDIPPNAKLLYGELTALASKEGYCWATNEYFATLYSVTTRSITDWVSTLEEKGFISTEKTQTGRKIYISDTKKSSSPSRRKVPVPVEEKPKSSISITYSNTNEEEATQSVAPISEKPLNPDYFFYKEVKKQPNKDDGIPMNQNEFVLLCRGASKRNIRIIAEHAEDADPKYITRGQWREFGRRNLAVAGQLAPYTDKQITEAFMKMKKDFKSNGGFITKWGLETLLKYI